MPVIPHKEFLCGHFRPFFERIVILSVEPSVDGLSHRLCASQCTAGVAVDCPADIRHIVNAESFIDRFNQSRMHSAAERRNHIIMLQEF